MNWLLEPTMERDLTIVVGFAAAFLLSGAWLRGGRRAYLLGGISCALLTIVVMLVSHFVVTDREEVETTLHEIAADVEANDQQAVFSHIHSRANSIRSAAQAEFPKYRFEEVDIKNNLKVEVDSSSDPPKAVATFNVVVRLKSGNEFVGNRGIPRFVTVDLEKEDGRWKVTDYDHAPPQEGF